MKIVFDIMYIMSSEKKITFKGYRIPIDEKGAIRELEKLLRRQIRINKKYVGSGSDAMVINNGHVTELALYHRSLKILPESIGNLTRLVKLYLGSNSIEKLPDSIGNLQLLEELDLSDNPLEILPETIGNLRSLRDLNLNDHKLSGLPKSIIQLENLIKIQIRPCLFSRIDIQDSDRKMLYAVMDRNISKIRSSRMNELQKDIAELDLIKQDAKVIESFNLLNFRIREEIQVENRRVVSLDIRWTKDLFSLPENIGDLSELSILYLEDKSIQELPESFGNLINLRDLNLADNDLLEIPDSFGNLINLEELRLHKNKLQNLPESIGELKKLKILNIRSNFLTNIPKSIEQLSDLKAIFLDESDVGLFSSSMKSKLKSQGCQLLYKGRAWIGGPGGDREDVTFDALTDEIVSVR